MNFYVSIAKKAVETYVNEEKIIDSFDGLPQDFYRKKAGVFITIKKQNELRSHFGYYLPTRPSLFQEIIENAIKTVSKNYSFNPIEKKELPLLSYTVFVLDYPRLVKNIKQLNPEKFGIVVKTAPLVFSNNKINFNFESNKSFKTAVLLPGLPGIKKPEEQFIVACKEAEINPAKEKTFVYKFKVQKFD